MSRSLNKVLLIGNVGGVRRYYDIIVNELVMLGTTGE